MPCLPAFQCLPLHIAEAIARYCYSTIYPIKFSAIDESKEAMATWTTLYSVSYSWQVLALEQLFKGATLNISTINGTGQFMFYDLPDNIEIDSTHYNRVRKVSIFFTDFKRPTGKISLHDFSSTWPENVVFPLARSLHVQLPGLIYQELDEESTTGDERFHWISQRIKLSMPKLYSVTVDDSSLDYTQDRGSFAYRLKADGLLSAIFDKTKALSICISTLHLVSDYSFTRNGTGLTHLECSFTDRNDTFRCIIDRSAPTLVSLTFDDQNLQNVDLFVFRENGSPIVYPRLRKLYFLSSEYATATKLRVESRIYSFPALQYLKWHSIYLFEDDTLFRGNSGTLEYLDIVADVDFAEMLQRYQVFTGGKYSKLCHVSIRDTEYGSATRLSCEETTKLSVNLIAPTTKSLLLDYCASAYTYTIAASPYLGNIQVLHVTGEMLVLFELCNLVRLLPNMTRLACLPVMICLHADSSDINKIMGGLDAEHCPLSHHLRHWECLIDPYVLTPYMPHTVLVLAILCPNFASVHIPEVHRKEFRRDLKSALRHEVYKKHADKLQRILRNVGLPCK